jgi:hypothetical protein
MGYVKLFGSLLVSSLMGEELPVRWTFVVMLTMADRDGIVEASLPGLAHIARLTIEECSGALKVLEAPDPHSRSKAHDGRRIEAIEGGWRVINYEVYRDKSTPEEARAKATERQRRKRERDASRTVTPRNAASRSVTPSEAPSASPSASSPVQINHGGCAADNSFEVFWTAYDKKVARPAAERAWKRIKPGAELAATITAKAAELVIATPDKQFRPNAATWLNNAGWNDEIVVSNGKGARNASAVPKHTPIGSYGPPVQDL